ncbi:ribosomal-protein-alanine N-acetyltransferase [Clostridium acetobutylicum]|uniref:[Ribosomal protein bS18]-alanine N-acetyltransferase n=1 Tax=Clostridium acetobutylicum (strain ATCC 824 / DSM 792 / JCM 1419 / IAM 19013 / LMG 5710 / NBRC 13948 / NRRL B-527 / VKM B-1787 / 2291 / W) TaxID=272562 RepID=Q97FA0_CLOAB|nr:MULTISPECIES: ribosomal protein S18-alanine N-acetyltransferase [Clostridium]AAK80784.1 Predicted acetyltransferase [Clostridium acetobutylicum ATCC 824]ADZ21885.1 acetyltransferase [Clostridium acetobutylicum EA 2018]AEI33938.1 acetyltransferase [Clostridium acetobutylicum DSM 1731]AWV78804.1 ribosomal-protein-alanine N-acetyltransferase [Clostridium acetobutylicum]MBC2393668.1 ribosomal protein S18-alanine N-acetyltransferase [Clostridium acetobutylicum]
MTNLTVHTLEKDDIDSIIEIENLCFPTPWTKESMEGELRNKFAKYVVIKNNNLVVGYGGLWLIIDEGHITNIAVHPEFRGMGIGNKILEELIKLCEKRNIPSMTLEVRISNTIAQNLYKKFGFKEAGVRKKYYGDNDEDALIMWRN